MYDSCIRTREKIDSKTGEHLGQVPRGSARGSHPPADAVFPTKLSQECWRRARGLGRCRDQRNSSQMLDPRRDC
eukprot:1227506-Pyramimonas_sp.AAC.1